MTFSNLVADLHHRRHRRHPPRRTACTDIQTSSQAAEALRPIAGVFTFAIFAPGIIGTGLLAVPVLAGSGAYAVAELFRWPEGLDRRPLQAKWFYAVIAASTLAGVGLNFTALDPVKALYWSAVLNGLLAAPLMAVIMLLAANPRVMGRLTLSRPMQLAGWLATPGHDARRRRVLLSDLP